MGRSLSGVFRSQRGFTLVEVLVAVVVLLIAATAFVPLYVYIAEATQANKTRLVATALAGGVMEEMRALEYTDIGTVGGSPAGVIPQTQTRTVGGDNYTIETRVWWVGATGEIAHYPTAYKRVQVTVEARGFTGQVIEQEDFRSLAAFEGEKTIVEAGHILVEVLRPSAGLQLQENVKIDLTPSSGPDPGGSGPHTGWTDSAGQILFGELLAGNYAITAKPDSLGMMARPERVAGASPNQTWEAVHDPVKVENWITTPVNFEVDWPVYLDLTLLVNDGTSPPTPVDPVVAAAAEVTLEPTGLSHLNLAVKAERLDGAGADELEVWWNWTYDLVVKADGYLDYRLSEYPTVQHPQPPWNGGFVAPIGSGTAPVTVEILLTPATP